MSLVTLADANEPELGPGKSGLTSRGRLLFNPQDIGDYYTFPKADSAYGKRNLSYSLNQKENRSNPLNNKVTHDY